MNNAETIRNAFSKELDTNEEFYRSVTRWNIDSYCWFADDNFAYKDVIVEVIVDHIIHLRSMSFNPDGATTIKPLFYLIDAISKIQNLNHGSEYQFAFTPYMSDCFRAATQFQAPNSILLIEKLLKLVSTWRDDTLFSEEDLDEWEAILNDKFQQLQMRPVQFAQDPMPQMQATQSNIRSIEPEPMPAPVQEVIVVEQVPDFEQENDEMEFQHFARDWMRPAVEWDNPPEELTDLVVSVDEQKIDEKPTSIGYIVITPENDNAICKFCHGKFERGRGPTGEECFIGVRLDQNNIDIVHERCVATMGQQDQVMNIMQDLLQK